MFKEKKINGREEKKEERVKARQVRFRDEPEIHIDIQSAESRNRSNESKARFNDYLDSSSIVEPDETFFDARNRKIRNQRNFKPLFI